ncbi:MAG: signal recognition particle-docking protein FtsY [Bdellovibrionota bacterium]|nr:signal recognition particle-docking protein FtsY [Bdellovibrionota bacterium]
MSLDVAALIAVLVLISLSALFAFRQRRKGEHLKAKSQEALEKRSLDPRIEEIKNLQEEAYEPEKKSNTQNSSELETTNVVEIPVAPAEVSEELPKVVQDSEVTQEKEAASVDAALENTRKGFWGRIQNLFGSGDQVDMEAIEEILYTSDLGPRTVQHLMEKMEESIGKAGKNDEEAIRSAIKSEMLQILESVQGEDEEQLAGLEYELLDDKEESIRPIVWMVVGVNGSGKTTSIGKMANILAAEGKKVMLAAGDTFRAAADAQLKVWSERAGVELFSPENVKDPSAVAFDACRSALAKNCDHVIVDTAGRLHTQNNLMEELKKMKRVVDKAIPGAPHETILVLDANNGQNALIQAREFHQALDLTGVILTKMDGSAKGGVVFGVAHELSLPIKRIGIGEKIEDLRSFHAKEFVDAII